MSAIVKTLPESSLYQGEVSQNAHRYALYNPQVNLSSANRWDAFLRIVQVVSIIGYVALSLTAISFAGSIALTALVTSMAIINFVPYFNLTFLRVGEKIEEHAQMAKMASGILEKFKGISENNIDEKFTALGIAAASGSFEQKRSILARYLYQEEQRTELLDRIRKKEIELALEGNPDLTKPEGRQRFSLIQDDKIILCGTREALARIQLDQAYILKVLQDPSATHAPSDFYHETSLNPADRLTAHLSLQPFVFIYQETRTWTVNQILQKTPQDLHREIF